MWWYGYERGRGGTRTAVRGVARVAAHRVGRALSTRGRHIRHPDLLALMLLPAVAACAARGSTAAAAPAASDPCVVTVPPDTTAARQADADVANSVVVAVSSPVLASHAPRPRNDAERLVFAQVYETLVHLDCHGRPAPGLAERWERSADGLTWTFTLRADATFADGSPVRAADVARAWADQSPDPPAGASLAAGMSSLRQRSDHELSISLAEPRDDLPRVLAHADYAVYRRDPGRSWPVGTGVYEVDAGDLPGRVGAVLALHPVADPGNPILMFRYFAGDARDALEDSADAVVTGDPGTIDYARSHPAFEIVPLAWSRTYALLVPGADAGAEAPPPPAGLLDDLARFAVPGDARPAAPGPRSPVAARCSAPSVAARDGGRLVYTAGDAVARAIAERLYARVISHEGEAGEWLARTLRTRPGARPFALAALAPEAFARALRAGNEIAFVLAVDDVAPGGCDGRSTGVVVHRLIETRNSAIIRRGAGAVRVDGRGGLRFGVTPDAGGARR